MMGDYRYIKSFSFFNDTATTKIYTLSLHDALPISVRPCQVLEGEVHPHRHRDDRGGGYRGQLLDGLDAHRGVDDLHHREDDIDRKSTRLNSSHANISYAVFCLKKKVITKSYILCYS